MHPSDYDKFITKLLAVGELQNRKLSPGVQALYWEALEKYSFEQVSKAFAKHSADTQSGQFFPKPADLIRHLEGTTTDRAAIAWSKVYQALGEVGAYQDVIFDEPAIHATIADLGGWPKLCRTEGKDMSYTQHQFQKTYQAHTSAGVTQWIPRLTGDRDPDDAYTRRGLPVPRAALIGDKAKCAEVANGGASSAKPIAWANVQQLMAGAIQHHAPQLAQR